jgi:hypothetical protein
MRFFQVVAKKTELNSYIDDRLEAISKILKEDDSK